MSILDRLACRLNRADEQPNKELAEELAGSGDAAAVEELVRLLWSKDKAVRNDGIKVMSELGALRPDLVGPHTESLLQLLSDKDNRMVWGAMAALATVADRAAELLADKLPLLFHTVTVGSVITVDNGIKVLARVASAEPDTRERILPFLLHHLRTCRPKEVPQHAESTLPAIDDSSREVFLQVLAGRETELSPAQLTRLKRIAKTLKKS